VKDVKEGFLGEMHFFAIMLLFDRVKEFNVCLLTEAEK
jgi:hypothetical protein